ncbi:Rad52/Rad22 family DNA repair protein [Gloeobacter kilaueensis]|uniref:Rad52/22 double-strand break repair protein n=1 Tax=Gloeobacter kilaueensis (strain ATCC BAA-2537 / CCAP 1431/1 / ULC 316 / JS1) TaxID=1183438 RepID=U5QCM4_GLOK1|nr:Rad52/Rad22 family DNA repair protein [Gloeobacter kilaueensis]AGY56672.1 hypothetical protein GKIL_0426 [Gloeobacter kilaueensis JS1]
MESQIASLSLVEPVIAKVQIKAQALSSDQSRAMAVAYLEARDVAQRLDDVCGPHNWSDTYHVLQSTPSEWVVECRLTVVVAGGHEVTKCDVGLGEDAKAAYSDAFKRAAVKYGLGRFLYTLPKVWGDYDSHRRRFSEPAAVRAQMLAAYEASHSQAAGSGDNPPPPSIAKETAQLSDKQLHWLFEDLLRRPGVEGIVQECFEKVENLSKARRALGYLLSDAKGDLRPRFERVGSVEEWRKFIDMAKQLPVALPAVP